MTGRKIAAVIFGILGVLVGVALITGGTSILVQDRDSDDFFKADQYAFTQPSHAIVSEDIEILTEAPTWLIDWITDPVDLRVQGTSAGGESLFLGIAPTADVDTYLAGVAHHEVTSIDFDGSTIGGVDYRSVQGTAVPAAPAAQVFWTKSTTGATLQTLDWELQSGNWTVVVMNADASAGVAADLALGAKVSNIVAISWIGIGIGILSVLLGGYLMFRGFFRRPTVIETRGGVVDLRDEALREEPPRRQEEIVGKR